MHHYFMHHQSELLSHIQNTNTQYNLHGFSKRIDRKSNRVGLAEHFPDPVVRNSIEADIKLLDLYHGILLQLERQVLEQARHHDPVLLSLLRTVPGIGKILALVMLREIHSHPPLPQRRGFHLLPPAGQIRTRVRRQETGIQKQQDRQRPPQVGLLSEAACLFLRGNTSAQELHQRLLSKYGKAKALSIIAQKLGRTVYSILKHRQPFDPEKFFHS